MRRHDWADTSFCNVFSSSELACFTNELGVAWHCMGYVDTATIRKLFQAARQLGGYHVRASEKESSLGSDNYPVWIARDNTRECYSLIWQTVREMESQA